MPGDSSGLTVGDLHGEWDSGAPRPPGKATGLLLRKDRPRELCRMYGDEFPRPDRDQINESIRAGLSNRPFAKWTYDQDGRGSCATEGEAQLLSLLGLKSTGLYIVYNPWPNYWQVTGGRDVGSSLGENLAFVRDRGMIPAVDWPRWRDGRIVNPWNRQPPDSAWEKAQLHRIDEFWEITTADEFRAALARDFTVYAGYRGHAIRFVALKDWNTLVYKNSWGHDWNDEGFGELNISSIYWGYGVYCERSIVYPGDAEIARIEKLQAEVEEYQ